LCHKKGVLVVADEIMCGLGRHGQSRRNGDTSPTLFLSEAWALPVDAVTFGKAICAGAYPMSGVICRRGAKQVIGST
jgi:adenosylmethionine-8-amino-7-oxononanoate aminotransferase